MESVKHQIEYKRLDEIRPYDNNPRRNDEAAKAVANSIKEFGFQSPIIVDRDGVIIAGHTRYKAARRLKLQEVPVIVAAELDPEKVKALRIADNSTGEVAEWDLQLLVQELTGIEYDMTDFGLNLQIKIDEEVKEDDFTAEPRSSPSPSAATSGCWRPPGHVRRQHQPAGRGAADGRPAGRSAAH